MTNRERERELNVSMEGEQTPSSALDAVFTPILQNEQLKAQIDKEIALQKREKEKEEYGRCIEVGEKYYRAMVDKSKRQDINDHDKQAYNAWLANYGIQSPVSQWTNLDPEFHLKEIGVTMDKARGGYTPYVRYYLRGFGGAALDAGDVATSLLAWDQSGFLDDEIEGETLANMITEKMKNADPKVQVKAAVTWQEIQGRKAGTVSTVATPLSPPTEST